MTFDTLRYNDWVRYAGLDWRFIEVTDDGDILLRDEVGHGNHPDKWPGSDVCQVFPGGVVRKICDGDDPRLDIGAGI